MAWCPIPLYNLHFSVGKGGENHYNDVRLVQCLVEMALRRHTASIAKGIRIGGSSMVSKVPVITGECDELLIEWIRNCQKGSGIPIDGRVDPMPSTNEGLLLDITSHGHRQYTLFRMLRTAYQASPVEYIELGSRLGINFMAKVAKEFTYVLPR